MEHYYIEKNISFCNVLHITKGIYFYTGGRFYAYSYDSVYNGWLIYLDGFLIEVSVKFDAD